MFFRSSFHVHQLFEFCSDVFLLAYQTRFSSEATGIVFLGKSFLKVPYIVYRPVGMV